MSKLDGAVDVNTNSIVKESRRHSRWIKPVLTIALLGLMLSACGKTIDGSGMSVDVLDGRIVDVNLSDDAKLFQPESSYFQRFTQWPDVWVVSESASEIERLCSAGAAPSPANSNRIVRGCSLDVDGKHIAVISDSLSEIEKDETESHEAIHAWLAQYPDAEFMTQGEREFFVRQMTLEWTVWDLARAQNIDLGSQSEASRTLYELYTDSGLLQDQTMLSPDKARFLGAMDSVGGEDRSRTMSRAILDSVIANINRQAGEKIESFSYYEFGAQLADVSYSLGIGPVDIANQFDFH